MTLIVHRKDYNPIQSSRFKNEIRKLAKARKLKAIGVVFTDGSPKDPGNPMDTGCWECHKCEGKFPRTEIPFEEEHPDALIDCPGCSYPFLMIK